MDRKSEIKVPGLVLPLSGCVTLNNSSAPLEPGFSFITQRVCEPFLSAIFSSLIKPPGQSSLRFSDIRFLPPRRVQAQDGLWVRDKSPMCPWLQFAVL